MTSFESRLSRCEMSHSACELLALKFYPTGSRSNCAGFLGPLFFTVFTFLMVAPLSRKAGQVNLLHFFLFSSVFLCLGETPAPLLTPISTSFSLYFSLFSVCTVSPDHSSLHCSSTASLLSPEHSASKTMAL